MPSTNKTLCLLAVTLAAAVAVAAADGPTWKDCGGAGAMATVSDISVVPFPVVPGKNVTLTVTVDIKETVMSGNVTTVGSYYGSPMAQHNGPACGTDYWTIQLDPAFSVTFNGLACPAKAGTYKLVDEVSTDSYIPQGTFDIRSSSTDQAGKPLYCADVSFTI